MKLTGSLKSEPMTGGNTTGETATGAEGAGIAESGAGRAAAGTATAATATGAGVTDGTMPSAAAIACASFGLMSRYPHSMREISDGLSRTALASAP